MRTDKVDTPGRDDMKGLRRSTHRPTDDTREIESVDTALAWDDTPTVSLAELAVG